MASNIRNYIRLMQCTTRVGENVLIQYDKLYFSDVFGRYSKRQSNVVMT